MRDRHDRRANIRLLSLHTGYQSIGSVFGVEAGTFRGHELAGIVETSKYMFRDTQRSPIWEILVR